MNTKALYSAIAIIALLIVALLIYNQSQERNQLQSEAVNNSTTNQVNQSNTNTVDEMAPMESSESMAPQNTNMVPAEEGRFSGEGDIQAPDVAVFEITYDGTTFSPSALDIKNGDIVVFKNGSDANFWPASNPHPQHSDYPEFDAKKPLPPGQSFQFKFIKNGKWGFHNHLNPSVAGTISVE